MEPVENGTSNITQVLSDLFGEVLLASESSDDNRSNMDVSQFLSILKQNKHSTKGSHDNLDFGTLIKLVDGWRNKLNLTKPLEPSACNYCEGSFRDVILAYNSIHGYVSLVVCLFGSLANALNVAVLTRRDLAAAPINRLLKWLAVADVLVMLEYVPFAVYRYLNTSCVRRDFLYDARLTLVILEIGIVAKALFVVHEPILPGQHEMPYKWAAYLLFHMHFAQIFHTASICLTLSLAVWRYVAIKYSDKNHILCTERRCSVAILSSFVLPPILCVPTFLVFDIHTALVIEPSGPMILYHVDADQEGMLYLINFWVHAVVIKLLPCCILTVISLWLIFEVYRANEHQKKIRVYDICPTNKTGKRQNRANKRANRTTKMLVAVLVLFLVTELPQGILGLLSGLLGRCFFKGCYDLFGELMDALALLNGAINFILYCSMSRQFRMTFRQLVWRVHLHKWPTPLASHSDGLNT
ncbi:Thyrotropin-releasing hormone receptor [Papilio machaon]|uniref:Thyrotropin-releasing hormone receptor n=1 Tax=Papilio machaon TaxID=76193 RepID=A0A194QVY6_PAPMA|nr:Thyrotropin-releasing hormone receptor [Papilio machaon]